MRINEVSKFSAGCSSTTRVLFSHEGTEYELARFIRNDGTACMGLEVYQFTDPALGYPIFVGYANDKLAASNPALYTLATAAWVASQA